MIKIEDYEWLVGKIINKYYSTELDREDLWQEGRVGLLIAREKFKKSKGIKFSTFAYKHVQKRLSFAIAKARPGGIGVGYCKFLKKIKSRVKDENADESIARIRTPLCNVDKELSTEIDVDKISDDMVVEKILSLISKDEAKLIKMYYGIGCEPSTQKELSKKLNITRSKVSYDIIKILKKITTKMVKLGDVESWS